MAARWQHGGSTVAAWWQRSVAARCHHARRYLGSRHVARHCAAVNRGRRLRGGGCDGTDEGEGGAEGKEGHQHAHQHLVAGRKRVQGHGGAGEQGRGEEGRGEEGRGRTGLRRAS